MTHTSSFVRTVTLAAFVLLTLPLISLAQSESTTPPSEDESLDMEAAEELFKVLTELRENQPEVEYLPEVNAPADILALSSEEQAELIAELPFGPGAVGGGGGELDSELNICFDYYTFDSVDVSIQNTTGNRLVAGTEATFDITLTNNNPYPIVDTGVYLKLYRELAPGVATTQMHDLVEEWQALSGLSIPAGETVTHSVTYDVPASAPSGSFRLVGYVAVAQAYNLAGLPFTDDVFGGVSSFTVQGEQDGTVAFDRNRTFLNEEQYYFASFAPQVAPDDPVRIASFLTNTTDEPARVELTWEVYRWDQQREEHRLSTETKTVAVDAGDTIPVRYTVSDTDHPVYLVSGIARVGDMTSRINTRFVRDGLTQTRLNFPAVTNYPLEEGSEATLFACAHNTSNVDQVPGGRIELELRDEQDQLIHSHTYEGTISGAMMGIADTFVPERTYDTFTLTARLFQDDREVESVSLQYDCNELGVSCTEADTPSWDGVFSSPAQNVLYGLAGVSVLALLGYLLYRRHRRNRLLRNFK